MPGDGLGDEICGGFATSPPTDPRLTPNKTEGQAVTGSSHPISHLLRMVSVFGWFSANPKKGAKDNGNREFFTLLKDSHMGRIMQTHQRWTVNMYKC